MSFPYIGMNLSMYIKQKSRHFDGLYLVLHNISWAVQWMKGSLAGLLINFLIIDQKEKTYSKFTILNIQDNFIFSFETWYKRFQICNDVDI